MYNIQTKKVKLYGQFAIALTADERPYPTRTMNDKFVSILYSEEIDAEMLKETLHSSKRFQKTTLNKASHL